MILAAVAAIQVLGVAVEFLGSAAANKHRQNAEV